MKVLLDGIDLEEEEDEAGVVVRLEDLPLCWRLCLAISALHLGKIQSDNSRRNFPFMNEICPFSILDVSSMSHLPPPVQKKLRVPEAENGSDEGVLHELQGEALLDQLRCQLGVFWDIKVLAAVPKSSQNL